MGTMRFAFFIAKGILSTLSLFATLTPSSAQETSNLAFVTQYIRQLGRIERIRATANEELQGDTANRMPACVRSAKRYQLELRSQVAMLQNMRLNPPFEELPANLAAFNERKIDLYRRMSEGCEAIMLGPKPGTDYGAIAAEAPKITAELEYIDHALFEASPLVFATLIDPVPDAKNQMSKLIITAAERTKLIADINSNFGALLDQNVQNSIVSAASVLRAYLLKDYTPSDARPNPVAAQKGLSPPKDSGGPQAEPPLRPPPAAKAKSPTAVTAKPSATISESQKVGGSSPATTTLVFPRAISPKYASEDPGHARMHTCVDQYSANKATNANGGLKWIQKGGGYYFACNERLKE